MSKRLKNELTQLFQMVCNGLNIVKEPIQWEDRVAYLTSMQDAVICIGTKVEKVVPECEAFVGQLSTLAEYFYQLSLREEMDDTVWTAAQSLCVDIEEEMKRVLPGCYEIVFLPYKISMWDSLESIYAAAIQNKECDVRVIPVPYYHVNEDRTELEMTYEGEKFAKQVPITDYREYAIEDNMPDVIFIHNPYDDTNRVTSLPEKYFSRELKKYTNHLVYVPYKVCGGEVKDVYCMTPGVNNAWRVFVQSEQVRNIYIKYQKPEKIVVAGSPKIDAVIQNEKYPPKMPEEWENVLGKRKVFLLNTHLNTLINYGEKAIKEIEHIIMIFAERKQAAVLWRPHPLSMETIKSMNPAILEPYCRVIEKFKRLSNGIYDETSEPHLAIALADAYIGDGSSMVTMFGITGKPVYIRNLALSKKGKKKVDMTTQEGANRLLLEMEKERVKSVYKEEYMEPEVFTDMVITGMDPLKAFRKEEFQNIIFDANGKAGVSIWKYVYKELTRGDNERTQHESTCNSSEG